MIGPKGTNSDSFVLNSSFDFQKNVEWPRQRSLYCKFLTLEMSHGCMWLIQIMRQYSVVVTIDQFRYIKIQPNTIDLRGRLWGITTEFVGIIPQRFVLRSIVLC